MCTGEGGATCIKTIIPLILDTVYGVGAMSELTILPSIVSTVEAQVRVDLEEKLSHKHLYKRETCRGATFDFGQMLRFCYHLTEKARVLREF